MSDLPLRELLELAVNAARAGGAVLQEQRHSFAVRAKGVKDFVTDADVAAQAAVHAVLASRFPDFGFLGEEECEHQRPAAQATVPTWIVDPLDGTTNYIHGLPFYAVSIGLAVGDELLLGVVFDPSSSEVFAAARGLGACLGADRVRVSAVDDLGDSLLAFSLPTDISGQEHLLDTWLHLSRATAGIRRTGSSALNLAWLAAGRFDVFYAPAVQPWDVAGGLALLAEAGGMWTSLGGSPYALHGKVPLLASNRLLHPPLVSAVGGVPSGAGLAVR